MNKSTLFRGLLSDIWFSLFQSVSLSFQKTNDMEIIALIENELAEGQVNLKTEAGLSLFIKTKTKNILFDTGSSGSFADNAEKLGVDLREVDFVVISHGHFDHTGGLERFFSINNKAKVYIKEEAKGAFFYKVFFLKKYIGVNPDLFKNFGERFVFVTDDIEISPGINIVTNIPVKHQLPADSKNIRVKKDGKLLRDDFSHEQMMVISEGENVHCFTGCSHHGILNMVESAGHLTEGKKINVIGGFHMYNPLTKGLSEKKQKVIETGSLLNSNPDISKIATGHCTGRDAFKILKSTLGDKLYSLNTGSRISL